MPYNLKGRRVLVTASSRGLGAAVAKRFAEEGCNVAINYVTSPDRAEQVAHEIQNTGGQVKIFKGDAGDLKVCEELVESTVQAFGGLDIVVSNAGYTKKSNFGDLHGVSDDDWDRCWQVNVKSQMALFRAAAPHFNSNPEGGVFLLTSSVAGVSPGGSSMPYSVTKAAGLHLMKCLASTQGPKIRVNAVTPGWLDTDWGSANLTPGIKQLVEEKSVLKRIPDLDDAAEAFITLAKNSSMTGAKMQVDSGYSPLTA